MARTSADRNTRWLCILAMSLAFGSCAPAQAPSQPTPQLSPQAAYDQATRPLDITRRSAANWSDAELAALAVATAQAKVGCGERTAEQFAGEDLLAFARLCAFAQMWQPVQQAAMFYLVAERGAMPEEKRTGFPNLATAFDYEIQASLHLNDIDNAIENTKTMLRTVPYDEVVEDATNATVRYIQLIYTDQAITLLAQRQPILLAMMKANTPVASGSMGPVKQKVEALPSAHPPLPLHTLYADGIALPAMQQFANQQKAAAGSYAELEAALPAAMSPDDTILTAEIRKQYKLLGQPLPAIASYAWLLDPAAPSPDLTKDFAAATVLLLFPDWCNQCVAMGAKFAPAAKALSENHARFYAVLAQAAAPPIAKAAPPKPPLKAPAPGAAKSKAALPEAPHVDIQIGVKPTAALLLSGTPTLAVPNETLATFAATDFPLLIVTDHNGIVRSILTAPENALVANGLTEQLAYHVIDHWPPAEKSKN
jgi:hypothetical protein